MNKKEALDFLNKKYCQLCGSIVCAGQPIARLGCPYWQEILKQNNLEDDEDENE